VRKKILVVEDDPDLVELLSFNLRGCGFVVSTASDGLDALIKARSVIPDLILLDLMLPELDGFGVCEILRREPETAKIPIIMVTAMSSQFARLAGLEAGANDYFTKPFSPKQLIARVQALLGQPAVQATAPQVA
jgi:two-component system alkaline phosphatase synthesis response regulator PhoP